MENFNLNGYCYCSNEYLAFSPSGGGGAVSRANINWFLKEQGLSVSSCKNNAGEDCLFFNDSGDKQLFLRHDIYDNYKHLFEQDPILSIDELDKVEKKWIIESLKHQQQENKTPLKPEMVKDQFLENVEDFEFNKAVISSEKASTMLHDLKSKASNKIKMR